MVLELHVWGPAFGLPSIDAQCIAITAYFVHCLPPSEWTLIASRSPDRDAFCFLPAVRAGSTWISGYNAILDFLQGYSNGEWDLDRCLDAKQQADSIAYSSFLKSSGQPLLDLLLYVSSENYNDWTRPALAAILQWPQQWTVPHQLRDQARRRSEHLGLSSLDLDVVAEEEAREDKDTVTAGIPKSLLTRSKDTVGSLLGKSGGRDQFRLDAVITAFLEPIYELVIRNGPHNWVFDTDKPSSLDCLLLGYLSLMCPPLRPPKPWIQDTTTAKYPLVLEWTQTLRLECFAGPTLPNDAFVVSESARDKSMKRLPWKVQPPPSQIETALTALRMVLDALPLVPRKSGTIISSSAAGIPEKDLPVSSTVTYSQQPNILARYGLVGGALSLVLLYPMIRNIFSKAGRPTEVRHVFEAGPLGQRNFGEVGRMLGLT